MSISTRTRFEIFKRDNFLCQYCGRNPPQVILHVDHILPVSKGGKDEKINLITSCIDCNLGKSNVLLEIKPQPLLAQHKIENERQEQVEAFNRFLKRRRDKTKKWLKEISDVYIELVGKDPKEFYMPEEIEKSCKTFLKHLPCEEIIDALHIASDRRWIGDRNGNKFFYGVCWRKIKGDN